MAVTTALWRAAHLRLDSPPHVLDDEIGLRLVRDTDALTLFLGSEATAGPDAWFGHPFMSEKFRRWRASMVVRARLADDLVEEQVEARPGSVRDPRGRTRFLRIASCRPRPAPARLRGGRAGHAGMEATAAQGTRTGTAFH